MKTCLIVLSFFILLPVFPVTASALPVAMTQPASGLIISNATLNAVVNPNGLSTTAWFEWGAGSIYNRQTSPASIGSGSAGIPVSATLTGLTPGAIYHFRIVATNSAGLARGVEQRFSLLVLTLNGGSPFTNECNTPFNDPGAVATSTLIALSAGASSSYAVSRSGTVAGWGQNSSGQLNAPADATNLVALAAGEYHALGIRTDGTPVAWGVNSSGQTTIPGGVTSAIAVGAGFSHSVVVQPDGSVVAWGANDSGQISVPPDATNIVAISVRNSANIALRADGTVTTWGIAPGAPVGLSNVVAIAAGYMHALALQADGSVVAWGANNYGQASVPPDATNIISIAAGGWHSLALRADGILLAWGAGTFNASPPDGRNYGQARVPAAATNIVMMAGGTYHTLAQKIDGTVYAWGEGSFGDLNFPANLALVNAAVTADTFNPTIPAMQTLIYRATNTDNAVAVAARNLFTFDRVGPVITLLGANPLSVPLGSSYIDPGATAADACAGDVSATLVGFGTVNTALPGTNLFFYRASDPSGNSTTNARTVFVVAPPAVNGTSVSLDYTNPVAGSISITLTASVTANGSVARAWLEFGLRPGQDSMNGLYFVPANYTPHDVVFYEDSLIPGVTYHYRVGISNNAALVYSADQTFTVPALFASGDANGDGIVDLHELNSALSNYWATAAVYMSNPARLGGGGAFQFAITNVAGWQLGVQGSSDLVTWTNLPTAVPVFQFIDPAGGAASNRFYRLHPR